VKCDNRLRVQRSKWVVEGLGSLVARSMDPWILGALDQRGQGRKGPKDQTQGLNDYGPGLVFSIPLEFEVSVGKIMPGYVR
jgi:hypothetical protein